MSLRYNIKNNRNTKTHIYFKPTDNNYHLHDIKIILDNDDKINLYHNNNESESNSYKMVTDYIYRIINKSGFLCKGLNPDYILNSIQDADAVVVVGSSMNILPNGNIFGFALIQFHEKYNSIYIDVICSHIGIKGAGDILINDLIYISKKLFMTEIYLTSVKSAITFYEKYGFTKYDKLCNDMCLMIKSMNKNYGGKKNTQKKSRKINKTRKNGVGIVKRCKMKMVA
jgi:hypothetical protein